MKKLTLREIQTEELNILKNTIKLIDKYHLHYSLYGGTLLGAIRHKGFIPWDDDIDICMERKDYDKFIDITRKEKIKNSYEVLCLENNNSIYPFIKIINKNIETHSTSSDDKYLWIDIFPLDKYPGTKLDDARKYLVKIRKYKFLIYLRTNSYSSILKENKSFTNKLLKVAFKTLFFFASKKWCARRITKIAKKNINTNNNYNGNIAWGILDHDIFRKESFLNLKKVDFEGEKFYIPKNYDEVLKSLYGNYMELPPIEKRMSHDIDAIKIK